MCRIGAVALASLPLPEPLRKTLADLVGDEQGMVLVDEIEEQEDQDEVEALLLAENTELDDYVTDWLTLPTSDPFETFDG